MTDAAFNFASAAPVLVPIAGAVSFNTGSGVFAAVAGIHSITINADGLYEFGGYYGMAKPVGSTVTRNNIRFLIIKNGVAMSPSFQDNYLRDSTGHHETGQGLHHIERCSSGDVITVQVQMVAGTGGIQNIDGLCFFNTKMLGD